MTGKRKTVNGIVTKGVSKKEYMQIYRQKTQEDQVKKTLDLGKLDTDFYKKLIKTFKSDHRTRKIIAFFWVVGLMGGIAQFTVKIAVTSIIETVFM